MKMPMTALTIVIPFFALRQILETIEEVPRGHRLATADCHSTGGMDTMFRNRFHL